ncbi:TOBE domain-containing protein [Candidatus Bathyarchaeota archaeon]|nr:TOBE domain-containing protein [Candidatus Bathyarchaeota archaeon]
MPTSKKHKPSCKIWIEHKGKPVLGKGGAQILEQIEKQESISKAARKLGMSYRYVWSYLQQIEKNLEEPVMETFRGGKSGGGGAKLTELGKNLLAEYKCVEGYLDELLVDAEYWEVIGLKISARNRLKGKVLAVQKEGLTAMIKVQLMVPAVVTSLISKEAVEDLNIKVGDEVEAVIKATEVMIAK